MAPTNPSSKKRLEGSTHSENCWRAASHHACAVAKIEELIAVCAHQGMQLVKQSAPETYAEQLSRRDQARCAFINHLGDRCVLQTAHEKGHLTDPSSEKSNGDVCTCEKPEPALMDHGMASLCEKCYRPIGSQK